MSEVRITGSEGPGGLTLRTVGLAGHGLPELAVEGLPPYLGHGWARVLGVLARHVASAPGVPAEVVPAPDVAVRLERRTDLPSGDALVPVPPPDRDPDEWRRDVLLRLFPEASA